MRLIDADRLKRCVPVTDQDVFENCGRCTLLDREQVYDLIDEQPTIDPVKHGKWIVVKRHEHYPSGKPYEQVQCPFCKRFDNNGDGSFCGYCGAIMERSEE